VLLFGCLFRQIRRRQLSDTKAEQQVIEAIRQAVEREPFSQALKMELVELKRGFSAVEMAYDPPSMDNIYRRAHGGAIFGLIDEAFETVCQVSGRIAVALNVNVTYITSPEPGARLRAEAREVSETRRTASYDINVADGKGNLVASCKALAYRTDKPVAFP